MTQILGWTRGPNLHGFRTFRVLLQHLELLGSYHKMLLVVVNKMHINMQIYTYM